MKALFALLVTAVLVVMVACSSKPQTTVAGVAIVGKDGQVVDAQILGFAKDVEDCKAQLATITAKAAETESANPGTKIGLGCAVITMVR